MLGSAHLTGGWAREDLSGESPSMPRVHLTSLACLLLATLPLTAAHPLAPAAGPADGEQTEAVGGEPASGEIGTATEGFRRHRKRQRRPLQLGTSGGNIEDFTVVPPNVACCGGTLGALLRKDDRYFILSNNHVLARVNQAEVGEAISQPGLNDTACEAPERNLVGTLAGFKKLKLRGNNRADAAIAETSLENVRSDGKILGIGIPGNKTVNPRVGLAVVKSGRTTGVTHGEVSATNVSGFVGFPMECGSEEEYEVRFSKVFLVVSTNNKDFSAGGDSGSVIYEDTGACPRAMGLLFAGTEDFTAANYMKRVMKDVKKMTPKGPAELVGCDPVAAAAEGLRATAETRRRERVELAAMRAQERNEDDILAVPGVVAMGIGRSSGKPDAVVFRVLVESSRPEIVEALPRAIEGVPVEVVVSGKLRALDCRMDGAGPALGGLAPGRLAPSTSR